VNLALERQQHDPILQGRRGSNRFVIESEGTLSLTVEPVNLEMIPKIYQTYADRVLESSNADKAASEALCVVGNPMVIPHLTTMVKRGWLDHAMLQALGQFPKEKGARNALVSCLTNEDGSRVAEALGILADWKHEVPVNDVRRLLKSTTTQVHDAALKYINTLETPEYLELLADQ
jgi:hypothetical protein